ncbi:CGNR zinc finger domain-containing protein [Micromonospora sp. NPDC048871]|uniref:CGNR zinc finger domain-containing protein n=1 Tax=unclassified Micromonospora TaxID=2617518 RepID=UPI002E15EC50|nr:CGNR zinc finger domain-containing protein [Micromonospora sp. NBC_01739]
MRGQPGGRTAAPDGLALVQAFINSVNVEFGPDEFADLAGFARWLARNGWPEVQPDELDRRDAIALREALRALAREHNGGPPATTARRTVAHISAGCPLVVGFAQDDGDPALLPTQDGVRGVLATVLAAVTRSVVEGTWPRLKACHEHRCEWVFYDRSRNRSSRWCSMDICGVRAKMRVYRQGRRQAEREPAPEATAAAATPRPGVS